MNSTTRIDSALATARERLLAARTTEGCWEGELSGNAFSTALAAIALRLVEASHPQFGVSKLRSKITGGLDWLVANANPDGGWGDYPRAKTNLIPTVCAWAALAEAAENEPSYKTAAQTAERRVKEFTGGDATCAALSAVLLKDLSDPVSASAVLAFCALSGRFGEGRDAWRQIPAIPFERAALPRAWYSGSRLTSLDSALPVTIAAGQLIHLRQGTSNPIRNFTLAHTLKLLARLQVEDGGFLESIPVTSIVLAAMAASGRISNLISKPSMEYLVRSQRADGSWAVTTDASVAVTSRALDALVSPEYPLRAGDAHAWLLEQQFQSASPILTAPSGGWSWTNAPGGVPNAQDTAMALLALWRIRSAIAVPRSEQRQAVAFSGVSFLIELQNSDGGVATFSQGAEKKPFGAGSADLTATAIRAWLAWRPEFPSIRSKLDSAVTSGIGFLQKTQRPDGSWAPLWQVDEQEHLTYGTSRVVLALVDLSGDAARKQLLAQSLQRAIQWFLKSQLPDGSWAVCLNGPGSVAETAHALEALASAAAIESSEDLKRAIAKAADWLAVRVESSQSFDCPSGRFYSGVKYTERLHPLIATVAALSRFHAVGRQASAS